MSSSDESIGIDEGEYVRNKGGRPVGTEVKPYLDSEINAAFLYLLKRCPPVLTGSKFINGLREVMMAKSKIDRSESAIKSFLSKKLRKCVPDEFNKYVRSGKRFTPLQEHYLSEYMKDTTWTLKYPKLTLITSEDKKIDDKDDNLRQHAYPKVKAPLLFKSRPGSKGLSEKLRFGGAMDKDIDKITLEPRGVKVKVSEDKPEPHGTSPVTPMSFKPMAHSTPRSVCQPEAGPSSSRAEVQGMDVNMQKELMMTMIEDYFTEFKVEAMDALQSMVNVSLKRKQEDCLPEITLKKGKCNEGDGNSKAGDDEPDEGGSEEIHLSETEHEEIPEVLSAGGDEAEVLRITESSDGDNQQAMGSSQLTSLIQVKKNTLDTKSISYLLSDSNDGLLNKVAACREMDVTRSAVLESPLRARIATVTVIEVFEVAPGKEDNAPFRVHSKEGGTLTIYHNSSLDSGNWSSEVTIDHGNNTLEEELMSVAKSDIVQLCQNGEALSPMTLNVDSDSLGKFQKATLFTKGRKIKALLKRRSK